MYEFPLKSRFYITHLYRGFPGSCYFFSAAAKKLRDDSICNLQPFLYKLISSKLLANLPQSGDLDSDENSNSEDEGSNDSGSTSGDVDLLNKDASSGILHLQGPEDLGIQINQHVIQKQKYTKRAHVVITFLCTPSPVLNKAHMSILVVFRLLRQNVQWFIRPAIVGSTAFSWRTPQFFFACGMTEQLNNYLHYIGLVCSQGVAHLAINSLGLHTEKALQDKLKAPLVFAPLLCIHNVEFEEKFHTKSISKKNQVFHGTWGYLHTINPILLSQVPHKHLSLKSYKDVMQEYSKCVIKPAMFLPSVEDTIHFKLVKKSQIAHVAIKYLTTCAAKFNLSI